MVQFALSVCYLTTGIPADRQTSAVRSSLNNASAGCLFRLSAQQSPQPADAVDSFAGSSMCRGLGACTEMELAQSRPVFCELHPSETIGRVGGDFCPAPALLRPQLAFADAFHDHSPGGLS
jgi:hypothetical protein